MANRRHAPTQTAPEEQTATIPTSAQEDTVTTDTLEREPEVQETPAPEEQAAQEPAAPEQKPEVVIDLTPFQTAVQVALDGADTATGFLSPGEMAASVTAYHALPSTKGRNKAKAYLAEQVKSAVNEGNVNKARGLMQIIDALTAPVAAAHREPKAPVDPSEAYVTQVASLHLALSLVERPEGLSDDVDVKISEAVEAARAEADALKAYNSNESEDKGEAPQAGLVAINALKIATGKPARKASAGTHTGSAHTGERHDTGKHIAEAFADVPEGTFLLVSEIRTHKSQEYGDEMPSAGAISARLFPNSGKPCSVPGVVGVKHGTDGKSGGRKVSV